MPDKDLLQQGLPGQGLGREASRALPEWRRGKESEGRVRSQGGGWVEGP